MPRHFLLALSIFFLAYPAFAADSAKAPAISVKAEISRAFLTIGDPVVYTVTIRHDPAIKILSNLPVPPEDIFHIKNVKDFKRGEEGQTAEGRTMTLTTFRLGEFIIQPAEIEYRDVDDSIKKLVTEPIYLTVKSIAEGEDKKDIRDIKSVFSIPAEYRWIVYTGLVLLAILLGLGGFLFWKHRKKLALLVPKTHLTPEDAALRALGELFDSDLLRRGLVKEYYFRLSEILRGYFEHRFQIVAIESTTEEILAELKNREIDPALTAKIQEVLEAADLAKFAKWKPEPTSVIRLNKQSRAIIEEATPKETEPAAAAAEEKPDGV